MTGSGLFQLSGTLEISSIGNLRFCTMCKYGFPPPSELKKKLSSGRVVATSSVSEPVAELCAVSVEIDDT